MRNGNLVLSNKVPAVSEAWCLQRRYRQTVHVRRRQDYPYLQTMYSKPSGQRAWNSASSRCFSVPHDSSRSGRLCPS